MMAAGIYESEITISSPLLDLTPLVTAPEFLRLREQFPLLADN